MDRCGEIPEPAENLLNVAYMKSLAHSCGIEEVTMTDTEIKFVFGMKPPINPERLPELIDKYKGCLSVSTKPAVSFVYSEKRKQRPSGVPLCEMLKKVLLDIKRLIVEAKSDIV